MLGKQDISAQPPTGIYGTDMHSHALTRETDDFPLMSITSIISMFNIIQLYNYVQMLGRMSATGPDVSAPGRSFSKSHGLS